VQLFEKIAKMDGWMGNKSVISERHLGAERERDEALCFVTRDWLAHVFDSIVSAGNEGSSNLIGYTRNQKGVYGRNV
jgi:hypothetical protein